MADIQLIVRVHLFIFSLRIFGRKRVTVQKENVDEIFTHNTISLARHFSINVAADSVMTQEGSKGKLLMKKLLSAPFVVILEEQRENVTWSLSK